MPTDYYAYLSISMLRMVVVVSMLLTSVLHMLCLIHLRISLLLFVLLWIRICR